MTPLLKYFGEGVSQMDFCMDYDERGVSPSPKSFRLIFVQVQDRYLPYQAL